MTGYLDGIGTVNVCIGCGCLVAGGPTRCKRCARMGDPKENRLLRRFEFCKHIFRVTGRIKPVWRYVVICWKGDRRARLEQSCRRLP